MEDMTLNTVDEVQEPVVEVPETATDDGVTAESVVEQPQETAKPAQSADENAKFAAYRREKETAEREANEARAALQRLQSTLNAYGYEGSAQEIADALEAQRTQKSPEEIRAEREARESLELEKSQLERELAELRQFKSSKVIEGDIAAIKKLYPDAPDTVESLGEDFIKIMVTGTVDAVTAYEIIQARKAKETKTPPKVIGAVNSTTAQDKDYYTPAEVDKLTESDYDRNPKLMDIVRKSMLKWK